MPVRFENVFYVYQAHSPFASSALNDINVSLNSHDFLALVGHTGSGKSTFAQQINALLKPTEGKVLVGELIPFEIQNKLSSLAEGVYAYNGLFEGYDLYEGYVDHQLSFVALIKDELILICESKKFALVAYQDENNFCPVMKKVKSIKQELLPQDVKEAYFATKEPLTNKYSSFKKEDVKNVFCVENKKKIKGLKSLKSYCGMVFQFPEYQLFEESVLLDVAFGPRNFGFSKQEAEEKAKEALKKVGIGEELFSRSPFELSGGQKRRVAIAGIIALNPKILILDEPTAGLDPIGTREMMKLFKSLYDQGTDIIMITHDMDLVLKYATRVLVLNHGNLISDSSPLELFAKSDLEKEYNLKEPEVLTFAKRLIKRGIKLNLLKIKDIDSLISELKEVQHG